MSARRPRRRRDAGSGISTRRPRRRRDAGRGRSPAAFDGRRPRRCTLDRDTTEEDTSQEEAFNWAKKGYDDVAKHPDWMARASVVDLLAPTRRAAADELRALLAAPVSAAPFAVAAPECRQFVERFLPGVVEPDSWDSMPCNGTKWDVFFPEWAECVERPPRFHEMARRHPGDAAAAPPADAEYRYDDERFSPLTTKAGGRVWSVYFAAPGGGRVEALHAAYPCQLLVRYDKTSDRLVYEAFGQKPALRRAFEAAYASFVENPDDAARRDGVATVAELDACDALAKATRRQRVSMSPMLGGADEDDGGAVAVTP